MRPPTVTFALPFLILLLTPTARALKITIPASSAAAIDHATNSGCHVATHPGKCDPDLCFASGGRCKIRSGKRLRCFPHVLRHGVEEPQHWSNTGPEECKGCVCNRNRQSTWEAPGKVPVKVWGEGGAKVEKTGRNGDGERKGGKCVIVPVQGCDAEDCFISGGRCRIAKRIYLPRVVEYCEPHVLDGLQKPVRVKHWREEHAEGKCMGCKCRRKNATKRQKKKNGREVFLIEGIELCEPESD